MVGIRSIAMRYLWQKDYSCMTISEFGWRCGSDGLRGPPWRKCDHLTNSSPSTKMGDLYTASLNQMATRFHHDLYPLVSSTVVEHSYNSGTTSSTSQRLDPFLLYINQLPTHPRGRPPTQDVRANQALRREYTSSLSLAARAKHVPRVLYTIELPFEA